MRIKYHAAPDTWDTSMSALCNCVVGVDAPPTHTPVCAPAWVCVGLVGRHLRNVVCVVCVTGGHCVVLWCSVQSGMRAVLRGHWWRQPERHEKATVAGVHISRSCVECVLLLSGLDPFIIASHVCVYRLQLCSSGLCSAS
eukprot:GFYU01006250.1.p2 GENE.GFYU01006250.1~~GFYU01006250.1.p2  ORF type:complete len:140 (+),score=11.22 GFYU01006250.1:246-665(+)